MRKIKILRIIARLNIGGPAQHTVLLNQGLNREIFETIFAHGVLDQNEGDMGYLACSAETKSIIIPELSRRISWKNDWFAFWKLFRLIKKERPDIIHTHTAKAGTLGRLAGILYNVCQLAGWPVSRLRGRTTRQAKLIHTFHGHVLHSYFGRVKSTIFIWIERLFAKFTDKIIAVNQRLKQELLNFGVGNPEKIRVILLGLELEKLKALKKQESANGFSVGIVGRLVPIKNHRMFLDSAKELCSGPNQQRAKFLIIGDGELREKLEGYAKQLSLEQHVLFMGWQRDLNEIYSNLEVVALTSLNEGTPVSLIEAMAAGKPVIAVDVGGVQTLLDSQPTRLEAGYKVCKRGILVKSQDVRGFSAGLRLLLEDKALRDRLGRAGQEFAIERFSRQRLIKDMEDLYKELAL